MQNKDHLSGSGQERKPVCSLDEARYQAITETSVDAIITSNQDGVVLTWNKGAQEMFGHGEEIIGEPVTRIIPPQYREAHNKGIERFLATGEKRHIGRRVELEGLRKDGTIFPLELSLSTWSDGETRFFGAIIRDLTERKRLESLREEVFRLMRHDLRSPLVGISGMVNSLLRKGQFGDEEREKLELVRHLGKQAMKLIDRSRLLFHIETGEFELEPERVDLVEMLSRLEHSCTPLEGAGSLPLVVRVQQEDGSFAEAVPGSDVFELEGDATLLETMLENLLRNAAEASPPDGEVRVTLQREAGQAVIDVHNAGVVPERIRNRFFEPYATYGKSRGTGLGTYSALLVARGHKGEIDFTTSQKQGTHVTVRLPLSQQSG